jgi:arylsulfatase
MHIFTHLKAASEGKTGYGIYADGMVEHDGHVGILLAKLKELGMEENTILMYATDNGAETFTWPDGGTTMFKGEKNTNWEGAFRVPAMVRWPGKIKAGSVSNDIVSHLDWLPTLAAIAGAPDVKADLLKGTKIDGHDFKVHLDGYNLLDYLTGKDEKCPRIGFLYFTDDAELSGLRYDNWKVVFMEQRCPGTCMIWSEPLTSLRVPKIFNLRTDPYEHADITCNSSLPSQIRCSFTQAL